MRGGAEILKTKNEILDELVDRTKAAGLDKYSGSLLYSALETVSPGRLYLLGYNPGGNPAEVTANPISHLQEISTKNPSWNEYVDEEWANGSGKYAPGCAPLQRRVQTLAKGVDLTLNRTRASNLIFVRSQDAASYQTMTT